MKITNIWATKRLSVIFLILLLIAMILSLSQPVYAATITVTANSSDVIDANGGSCSGLVISHLPGTNGEISLREAICAANNTTGDDNISLPAGTYTLTINGSDDLNATGDLDIRGNLTITGDNARTTIIQAGTDTTNGIDRVFEIHTGVTATLDKLTIRYGRVNNHGGGIFNKGTLTINESTISHNTSLSTFQFGGGIRILSANLTLNQSTVSDNTATKHGGGIQLESGTLTVNNSTISNNSATDSGGGIYINNGTAKLNNSTISNNTATVDGGGIRSLLGTSEIKQTILSYNNSVNSNGNDCSVNGSSLTSAGYNLVQDSTNCFTLTGSDKTGDPLLGDLTDNGGSTDTHAITDSGSPAVDAGDPTNCQDIDNQSVTEDQLGAARPIDGNDDMTLICDIGAYELQVPTAVTLDNLSALAQGNHVLVTWNTVSESDNLGFYLYRSITEQRVNTPLNNVMISAQVPGSGQGASYSYEDDELVAGTTYYYWLADVNLNDVETYHGPVTVVYDYSPTAITSSTLESKSNRVPLAGLVALLGVVLMAGRMLMRREE